MSISPSNKNDANSSGAARSEDTLLGDPQSIKYKKAVREISKLINLVKSLKAQISDLQYDLQEAQIQNQHLERRIRQAENTKSIQPDSDNKKSLEDSDEKVKSQKEYRETRAFELEEAIVQKQRIIVELETLLDTKRTQNIQLYHKCDKLERELSEQKLRAESTRFQREEFIDQEMLQNQLKKSEQYIRMLTEENNKLKEQSKMMTINSQYQSQPYWQLYKQRGEERGKRAGHQKIEDIKNEYKHKREKYKKQIKQLQQSEKFYVRHYEKVTHFVEKQQKFIEKCILSPNSPTNFNHFNNNNYSAFTQNQSEYDVYRL